MTLERNHFENIVGKGENAGNQHFLLFPQCFLYLPRQISILWSHLFCRLQMCLMWTDVKLSFGKELKTAWLSGCSFTRMMHNILRKSLCYIKINVNGTIIIVESGMNPAIYTTINPQKECDQAEVSNKPALGFKYCTLWVEPLGTALSFVIYSKDICHENK